MASAWAIWELTESDGERWDSTETGTLVEAESVAERDMAKCRWYGVGIRPAADQRAKWSYLSMRDGPTDRSLLKPRRKKKEVWPKLIEGEWT